MMNRLISLLSLCNFNLVRDLHPRNSEQPVYEGGVTSGLLLSISEKLVSDREQVTMVLALMRYSALP